MKEVCSKRGRSKSRLGASVPDVQGVLTCHVAFSFLSLSVCVSLKFLERPFLRSVHNLSAFWLEKVDIEGNYWQVRSYYCCLILVLHFYCNCFPSLPNNLYFWFVIAIFSNDVLWFLSYTFDKSVRDFCPVVAMCLTKKKKNKKPSFGYIEPS